MSKLKLFIGGLVIMALSFVVPQSPFTSVAESQVYPPVTCTISVSSTIVPQGATISVFANCFLPGSTVNIVLRSHPQLLGKFTANARGEVSGRVTIPCDAHLGAHTVSAEGVDAGGRSLVLRAGIRVVDGCDVDVTQKRVVTGGGALSKTGSDMTVPLAAAGLALMATGTAAVVAARRRRAAQAS